MKKLFLKLTLLILPFLIFIGFCEFKLRSIPTSYRVKKAAFEKRMTEWQILVLGSSHAYEGLSVHLLDQKTYNLANSSQSLYYDSKLLLLYLDQLSHLKLVIWPVDYFSFEFSLSSSAESWRSFFYHMIFHIPHEDKELEKDIRNYSLFALYGPKRTLKYLLKGFQVDEIGGTLKADGGLMNVKQASPLSNESAQVVLSRHHSAMREENIAENVAAMDIALHELRKRKISVVFVSFPAYHTYSDQISKVRYERMQRILKELCNKYQIQYFNYFFSPDFKETDFFDDDHLNSKGAEKLSARMHEDFVQNYLKN